MEHSPDWIESLTNNLSIWIKFWSKCTSPAWFNTS